LTPATDHDLLRSWLGLPPGPWPPDHYALLGLRPGEADPAAVEPRVLDRMDTLRRHQLLHPELVTEGMNRLAQALICLSAPAAKAAYDAELGLPRARPAAATAPPRPPALPQPTPADGPVAPFDDDVFSDDATAEPPSDATQVIEVRFEPGLLPPGAPPPSPDLPPVPPGALVVALPFEVVEEEPPAAPLPYEVVPDAEPPPRVERGPPLPLPPPTDRRDRAARRWVYTRLALIRRGIRAWDRLRPVLADPQEPFDRPGRVLLLLEAVREVRPLLPRLRGVVGGPGEPGAAVAAVIGRPLLLDAVRSLLPDQRQAVAIDWRRGDVELRREYRRLRALSRAGRELPAGPRGSRVLARWAWETPELVLVALAAAALLVALVRGVAGL